MHMCGLNFKAEHTQRAVIFRQIKLSILVHLLHLILDISKLCFKAISTAVWSTLTFRFLAIETLECDTTKGKYLSQRNMNLQGTHLVQQYPNVTFTFIFSTSPHPIPSEVEVRGLFKLITNTNNKGEEGRTVASATLVYA